MGVVSFSVVTNVALPFKLGRSQKQTIREIGNIKHTGGVTRIAPAVQLGLTELKGARREDAKQVLDVLTFKSEEEDIIIKRSIN